MLRKRQCNLDHSYSTILNSRGRPLDARGCLWIWSQIGNGYLVTRSKAMRSVPSSTMTTPHARNPRAVSAPRMGALSR